MSHAENRQITADEIKKLKAMVKRLAEIDAQKKQLAEEANELLEVAFEKTGMNKKAVKQLAKEWDWNEIDRAAQLLLEEDLDRGRAALGMLADLPLGEHAQNRAKEQKREREKEFMN